MRVRFAKPAARQLGMLLTYLNQVNPEAARALRQRVEDIRNRLAQFPDGFQKVGDQKNIRRAPLTPYPYVVFDRVLSGDVEIVAVVHGARDKPLDSL